MTNTVFAPFVADTTLPETPEQRQLRERVAFAKRIKENSKAPWRVFQYNSCNCIHHEKNSIEKICRMDKWSFMEENESPSGFLYDTETDAWIGYQNWGNWLND